MVDRVLDDGAPKTAEAVATAPGGMGREGLTFSELHRANKARCADPRDQGGFDEPLNSAGWSPVEWAAAVSEEAGEVCGAALGVEGLKGSKSGKTDQDLADELADVVIMSDLLATRIGRTLGSCVADKFNRVSEKRGSKHRLSGASALAVGADGKERCSVHGCVLVSDVTGDHGGKSWCWTCSQEGGPLSPRALADAPQQPPAVVAPKRETGNEIWAAAAEAREMLGNALYPGLGGDSPPGTANTLWAFAKEAVRRLTAPVVPPAKTPPMGITPQEARDRMGLPGPAGPTEPWREDEFEPATPPPVQPDAPAPVHICNVKGCGGASDHDRALRTAPTGEHPIAWLLRTQEAAVQADMGEQWRPGLGCGASCERCDKKCRCTEGEHSRCLCEDHLGGPAAQPTPGDAGARPAERVCTLHGKAVCSYCLNRGLPHIEPPVAPPRRPPEELAREAAHQIMRALGHPCHRDVRGQRHSDSYDCDTTMRIVRSLITADRRGGK